VGHWKGRIASIETIHGEIDVMMFFPVNGPSGTYSHFCMSRIDQSFMRTCGGKI
jgi:queuine/archaeosine tRNA-ribosyltransferase